MSVATSAAPTPRKNYAHLLNFLSGISGVTAGGNALLNIATNQRIHRILLGCSGIFYQPGTTVVPATADAGATFTPVIVNGVITAITIVGAVSTKGNGTYALTIKDPTGTGQGATGTYTVSGTTVVSSTAVTNGGVISPIPPQLMITSLVQAINGSNFRDILPADIMRIARSNNYQGGYLYLPPGYTDTDNANDNFGVLPIYYTEPWRQINRDDEITSWDLFGQQTFTMQIGIAKGITSPSITPAIDFDYTMNQRTLTKTGPKGKAGDVVQFLQPVAQHRIGYPVPAGRYDYTLLPAAYPLARLWLYDDSGNNENIYQVELIADGNQVLQCTLQQLRQFYAAYNFELTGPNPIGGNPVADVGTFMAAFIADPDQRLYKALRVAQTITLRTYTTVAANMSVVIESLPGKYVGT